MPARRNPRLSQEEQEKLDKGKRQFAKARKHFRPRKGEQGSYVFIAAHGFYDQSGKWNPPGTRLPKSSRRKGYMVYVTRSSQKHPRGRVEPVREKKTVIGKSGKPKTIKEPPTPKRVNSFNIIRHGKKKAAAKWYADRLTSHEPVQLKRGKGQHTLDFMDDIVPQVARDLQAVANAYRSKRSFVCRCAVTIQREDGVLETHTFQAHFAQADVQKFMELDFYFPFVSQVLYAAMAEALSDHELVTTGSARYVRKLAENAGEDREDWTKRGKEWDKVDYEDVKIVRFEFQPQIVVVRNR